MNIFGLDVVPDSTKAVLNYIIGSEDKYASIRESDIIYNDFKLQEVDNLKYMEELRSRDSLDLLSQRQQINILKEEISRLSRLEENQSFDEITKEVGVLFSKLDEFAYSNEIISNFTKTDTLTVFTVKWNDSLATPETKLAERIALEKWLKERLDLDTLVVKEKN